MNENSILKLFYLRDFRTIIINLVNFYALPYFNKLNKISINALVNSEFYSFILFNKKFEEKNLSKVIKVNTVYKAYENLWAYFFSIFMTNSLFFLLLYQLLVHYILWVIC